MTIGAMYQRETRKFCKENGICQRCHKKKAAINLTMCPECLEHQAIYSAEYQKTESARKARSERDKKRYAERRAKGLCVLCGKPAKYGRMCYEHYIEDKRRGAEHNQKRKIARHERGLLPEVWVRNGKCRFCGEDVVAGKQLCKKHYEISVKTLEKARESREKRKHNGEDVKRRDCTA